MSRKKKKNKRASEPPRTASLLKPALGGLAAAAAAIALATFLRPLDKPAPAATQAPVPQTVPANEAAHSHARETESQGAATVMMGGRADAGLTQFGAKAQTVLPKIDMPPAWATNEGLIALDAVCETIEPPSPKFAPGNPAPSTRKMAARLEALYSKAHPESMAYLSDKLAEVFQKRATNATALNERFRLMFNLAVQQINASRPDAALNTFSAMEKLVAEHGGTLDDRTLAELRLRKGIAFLRLGEQENCLATHNADSCVFPLRDKAFHMLPRGSQGAIAMFSAHLAEYPNDYSTRWLLNLAHMTIDEYPAKVNPQYLIPPEKFASEHPMPRFYDVSDGLGIDANDLAGGAMIDDFNNDGYYDVVISAWDNSGQVRFFVNNRNGKFVERTSEAGLVGETGSLNIVQTDYNNDGHLDMWLMRGGWLGKAGRIPSSLMRNNGDGTFADVTEEAGLLRAHPTMATRWFDFNGDGWLDLFIGNESLDPKDPDYCELFRNNGNGTFTECAFESGIKIADFIKGLACLDYDNDGRPDLYLSVRGGNNILLRNDGEVTQPDGKKVWRFSDASFKAGFPKDPQNSFGAFAFDYDNDGWQDLVCFGYYLPNGVGDVAADYMGMENSGAKSKVYRNDRGVFKDVTRQMNFDRITHAMGHNYGDLDNDGWLDFYANTGDPDFRTLIPSRMFRNGEGKRFQDVTTATGTGHVQKGHGVAFADMDDDGFQDVYATYGGAYAGDFARNALYHNPRNENHFLKLKLVGVKANRAAIGARMKVTVQTPTGTRELHRVVSTGGSFGGNPLRQEIGLGDATKIVSVHIRWPGSNTEQVVTNLDLDRAYLVREGEKPEEVKLNPVNIKHAPAPKMKFFGPKNT